MTTAISTVTKFFEEKRAHLMELVPSGVDHARMWRVLLNAVMTNPALAEATPHSTCLAVITALQLGLEPGVFNQAWLVPYMNKRKGQRETKLIVGYGGLLDLAMRSGVLHSVSLDLVRQGDRFEFVRDAREACGFRLEHGYDPFADRTAPVLGGYCILVLRNRAKQVALMSEVEIQAVRARSRASNSGPWVTDEDEMRKKTVLRRALKLVPLTPEAMRHIAMADEEEFDFGKATEIPEINLSDDTKEELEQ